MTFELNAPDGTSLNASRGTEFNARGQRNIFVKVPKDQNTNILTAHQPSFHNRTYGTVRNGGPNIRTAEKRIVILWIITQHIDFDDSAASFNRRDYLGKRAMTDFIELRSQLANYGASVIEALDINVIFGMHVLMLGPPPSASPPGGNIGDLGFPATQDDSRVPITAPSWVTFTDLGDVTLNPSKAQIQACYDAALANLGSGRAIGNNRTGENNSIDGVIISQTGLPFADGPTSNPDQNLDDFIVDLETDIGTGQSVGTDVTKPYIINQVGSLGSDWMQAACNSLTQMMFAMTGDRAWLQITGFEFPTKNPVLTAGPGAGNVTITFDSHGWNELTEARHGVFLSTSSNPGVGTVAPNFLSVASGDVLDADSLGGISSGSTIFARVLSFLPRIMGAFLGSNSQFIYLYPSPKADMEVSNSVVVP